MSSEKIRVGIIGAGGWAKYGHIPYDHDLRLGRTPGVGRRMVSSAVVALAPNYVTFIAGRALIVVAIGGFWSMSVATAMRLVPAAKVPQALAIVKGGNALATVVAAPLGSYLGSIIGWRGAFSSSCRSQQSCSFGRRLASCR